MLQCKEVQQRLALVPVDLEDLDADRELTVHLDSCSECQQCLATLTQAYQLGFDVSLLDEKYAEKDVKERDADKKDADKNSETKTVNTESQRTEQQSLDHVWAKLAGQLLAPVSNSKTSLDSNRNNGASTAENKPAGITIQLSCTFCHDSLLRSESRYCASCLAPHHDDCFDQHGRCAAPGCSETQFVKPTSSSPTPPITITPRTGFTRPLLSAAMVLLCVSSYFVTMAFLGDSGQAVTDPGPGIANRPDPLPEPDNPRASNPKGVWVNKEHVRITEIVDVLREDFGLHLHYDKELFCYVSISGIYKSPRQIVAKLEQFTGGYADFLSPHVVHLRNEPKISVNLVDKPIRDTLNSIADFAQKKIVIGDSVQGRVSIRVKNMPWYLALKQVARVGKAEIRRANDIIVVDRPNVVFGSRDLSRGYSVHSESCPGGIINLNLNGQLDQLCEQLATQTDASWSAQSGICLPMQTINLNVKQLPCQDFCALLKMKYGLALRKTGARSWQIYRPDSGIFRARNCEPDLWYRMLSKLSGTKVQLGDGFYDEITCELDEISCEAAIGISAVKTGYEVHSADDGFALRDLYYNVQRKMRDTGPDAIQAVFANFVLQLQATAFFRGRAAAVISGQIYYVSDQIKVGFGRKLKLTNIEAGQVTVEYSENGVVSSKTFGFDGLIESK